jgi:hypothetical protein
MYYKYRIGTGARTEKKIPNYPGPADIELKSKVSC